jgi:hypothetical protein
VPNRRLNAIKSASAELLIAKQQYRVVEPRLVDVREYRLVYRTKIDATDLGAQRGAGWDDVQRGSNRHVAYGKIPDSNARVGLP